jgi:CheY-like chemotaxis protein
MLAGRAAEALDLLPRHRVHVIVSDIGLPEMDGYEFIRRVRDLPADAGGAAPAIALTSFSHADDRRRALLAGFQVHLAKPVRPEEFRRAVHTLATMSRAAGLGPP